MCYFWHLYESFSNTPAKSLSEYIFMPIQSFQTALCIDYTTYTSNTSGDEFSFLQVFITYL